MGENNSPKNMVTASHIASVPINWNKWRITTEYIPEINTMKIIPPEFKLDNTISV